MDLYTIARNPHFSVNAQKKKAIMDVHWAKYGEMVAKGYDEKQGKEL